MGVKHLSLLCVTCHISHVTCPSCHVQVEAFVSCVMSLFMTLSHSSSKTTHLSAQSHRKFWLFLCERISISDEHAAYLLSHFLLPVERKSTNTMAFWKAAFAALSLFAAAEGFTTPSVNRVSQPLRMTATLDETDLGTTATENLRNIAGA